MDRLFIGLGLPEKLIQRLSLLVGGLPGARWLEPENLHVTLRFLGEVGGLERDELVELLDKIKVPTFELKPKGLGHFPPRGEPKVLWAGFEKNQTLVQLQKKLESRLQREGYEPERRKFYPHITLARLQGTPPNRLAAYFSEYALWEAPAFQVQQFHIFSSHLHSEGTQYQKEVAFDLT